MVLCMGKHEMFFSLKLLDTWVWYCVVAQAVHVFCVLVNPRLIPISVS